ncbi:MAG: branched-chain amino acid ABC transporter permease [Chloroflexi bacterium]|nr:branched-chain amino acid ABC transporter permease [Chloroflexota bacterium]
MNWVLVPQQFINGLLNGGTIALIALGIVLVYRSSEVFNFAHGHSVMIGAYLTWWFATPDGIGQWVTSEEPFALPLWVAILLASGIAVLLGLLIERLALRPMTGQPLLSIVLMTLGLSQLLGGLVTVFFGTEPKANFPTPFAPTDTWDIPFPGAFRDIVQIGHARFATFAVAIIAAILLILFFQYTKTGLAMRATSENHELAQSVGIPISRVFGLSWAIAGIIATLGGVLLATLSGVSINLSTVALIAFPAILLGGLESFPGAILGGISVGLIQALVQASSVAQVRSSADIAPYILLLIVLVLRPEGLFGQKRIERI